MSELAYKFTRPGGRSPFAGFVWPQGEWVEVDGDIGLCTNGIHACRPEALPRWIDDELWLVELEDVQAEHDGVVIARRGRLVERIEGWDAETSRELARSCAARVRALAEQIPDPLVHGRAEMIAEIADGPDPSATALAMYTAAHTFDDVEGSYYEERRRQADWLRERLQLDTIGLGAA
jgi:hypothetical protein